MNFEELKLGGCYDIVIPTNGKTKSYYSAALIRIIKKDEVISRQNVDVLYGNPAFTWVKNIAKRHPNITIATALRGGESFANKLAVNTKVDRYVFSISEGVTLVLPPTIKASIRQSYD